MKHLLAIISILGLLAGCQSTKQLQPVSQIKPDTVQEGSLANDKLIADTTNAIRKVAGAPSISHDTQILKFVIQRPVGDVGARSWREIWIVSPHNNPAKYLITFKEAGLSGAKFDIQPMKD